MMFSCYEWNPKRFHPQFSGMAERYAEHKKRRLTYQQKRKQLDCQKAYTLKLNQQIQKQIQSKTLELSRLKETRRRHFQDLSFKQQLYEKRQQEIRSLRDNNIQQRSNLKSKIAFARKNLQDRNQRNRMQLQMEMRINSSKLEKILLQKKRQNSMKYHKAKQDQELAQSRITDFHRQQNQKSLLAYNQRIRHENKIKTQELRKIRKHEREIARMNQTAESKRKQLEEVQQQISMLTSQSRTISFTTKLLAKRRQTNGGSHHLLDKRTHSNFSLNSDLDPEINMVFKHM